MTYKIELTAEEILLVGQSLDLLPHGRVAGLVKKIQGQIEVQEREVANIIQSPTEVKE